MRNQLLRFVFSISSFIPSFFFAQADKAESSPRLQAGISGLPVYDFFNQQPQNKIRGAAIVGNFGCFLHPRISFGINPYFSKVLNSYTTGITVTHEEQQKISTFGLNTYVRGYFVALPRFSAFVICSAGFGAMSRLTTSTDPLVDPNAPRVETLPLASFFAGPGVSWNLTPHMAVELNLPLAVLYYLEDANKGRPLLTALPTLGLQFSIEKK
jgi:hypothetical protein